MLKMSAADARKLRASTSIAIGALSAWTRIPPSDGPATWETASDPWSLLFAPTSSARSTSEGRSAPRARSVAEARHPATNATA